MDLVSRDISRGEMVEAEIDSYIARADERRRREEGDRRTEEAWAEYERRDQERQEREALENAYLFNMEHVTRLTNTFGDLIARRRAKAQRAATALKTRYGIEAALLLENGHHEEGG